MILLTGLIETWDVLKLLFREPYVHKRYRINRNMGCIEIPAAGQLRNSRKINRNMGCIEIDMRHRNVEFQH